MQLCRVHQVCLVDGHGDLANRQGSKEWAEVRAWGCLLQGRPPHHLRTMPALVLVLNSVVPQSSGNR